MEQSKEYFAFISYKSEDVEWATWLQHELEHYHLPASFNGRTDVPQELRPVFRDIDELSAGNLPEQIKKALANSQNLIVICSLQAAESPWVNQEVETFIDLGRTDRIFPFIVEGNSPSEFFPPALRNLPKNEERLGGDISKKGRDAAFVKIVAGMLGVDFDSLWNRYEKEKAEEERKQREQRDRLLISQSRFLAEKANSLVEKGDSYTARLLALEALPIDVENPDKPYTAEAEFSLRSACIKDNAILCGHTDAVNCASFSPDGKFIVSVSNDKTIRLWSVNSGKQLFKTSEGHAYSASLVACSPDGQKLVSIFNVDGGVPIVRIRDAKTGKPIGKPLEGHNSEIYSVAFSLDGKYLVLGDDYTIRIWDVESRAQIGKPLEGHGGYVNSVAFSPDGKYIVSASHDKTVRIWDVESRKQIGKSFEGHTSYVYSASFSSNGNNIISVSGNAIRIWDVKTEKLIKEPFKEQTNIIWASAFSHDRKYVALAFDNHTIRICDANTGKFIGEPFKGHTDYINTVSFSPDGKFLISASDDKDIRLWDIKSVWEEDNVVFNIPGQIEEERYNVTISPDGKYAISCCTNENMIHIWDIYKKQQIGELFGKQGSVRAIDYSPDGKYIVSASEDCSIQMWDATPKTYVFEPRIDKRIIDLWDGRQIGLPMIGHTDDILSVAFNNNGKYIVSSSWDGTIRVWDAKTRLQIGKTLVGHEDRVWSAHFSPDDKYIVSASADNTVRIWDVKLMKVWKLLVGHTGGVNTASFSPDGKFVISASWDETIRVWDVKTGEQLGSPINGHNDGVLSAVYSPDGKYIVSASADKTIRIWNANTRRPINEPLIGHTDCVFSAFFTPNGEHIISAGDNTVRIWDFPPLQQLINKIREQFKNRQLTLEERKKYYLD